MRRKKIAFVIPSLPIGGAERVVTALANELVDDYHVCIITFKSVKPFYKLNDRIKLIPCVDDIYASSNAFMAIKSNLRLIRRLHSIVNEESIELLIGFLTSANVLATIVAKMNRIPCIISERNNPNSQKIQFYWRIMKRLTYPLSNYIVVQTQGIKSYYSRYVSLENIIILPNPISAEVSKHKINEEAKKENIILNMGRLTEQKAQDVLIHAFGQLKTKNWKLIIAGDGPRMEQYKKLILDLGLSGQVELKGNVKNIHEILNKAKIFAFSSLYEGFPNALIEAMYYGLGCISTDCPSGPSELIENGNNGFLVPINDIEAMTDKLNILINNPELRIQFGKRAEEKAAIFEIDKVKNKWKDLMEVCLI